MAIGDISKSLLLDDENDATDNTLDDHILQITSNVLDCLQSPIRSNIYVYEDDNRKGINDIIFQAMYRGTVN